MSRLMYSFLIVCSIMVLLSSLENKLAECNLKPGLGGVRDVASAIISDHEETQSNRVCCFKTLEDDVFPKNLFLACLVVSMQKLP